MKKLCVLLVSILLIAGLAACGGDAPSPATSDPPPVQEPTPEPTVPEEPEQRPEPEPVDAEEPENVSDVPLFTGANWSMEIADGWIDMGLAGISALMASGGSGSNINVVVENMQGMSLDDYVDANLEMLEALLGDFELLARDRIEINGKNAVFTISDVPAWTVYLTYQFVVEVDGTAFIITYTRMDETDHLDCVLDMLATFTVYGATAPAAAAPAATTAPQTSHAIGEWHMISSDDEIYTLGLATGWGYDIYIFEGGTGIEWWFSPYTLSWHQVFNFGWTANDGNFVIIYISINEDVIAHYLGNLFVDLLQDVIGVPFMGTYSVTDDTFVLELDGVRNVFQRNPRT